MLEHDVVPGPLHHCQISGSSNLHEVIDLRAQPLCDGLLDGPDDPETHYPLSLNLCPESGLAQLGYIVDGKSVYPPSYPYRSGISKPLADYQRAFADKVLKRFRGTAPNPLVVDIGSNDGTLLTGFKAAGCRALGIEPTDVAQIARSENNIMTWQKFFDEDLAHDIILDMGVPRIVTMTNVFAHMANLGEIMRGIRELIDRPDAPVFITESHYLLDVLEKKQFDTIYHEHVRTYSLRSLCVLAEQYGLEVFDVERGERYGGNIRAYIARKGAHPVESSVGQLLSAEIAAGLFDPIRWGFWAADVRANMSATMEYLWRLRREGQSIVGCSAPGRACTLLNYYGITRDLVYYTGELSTSLKLGKYLPGSRIPVVDNRCLRTDHPDNIILFAWHYAEPIMQRLRAEGVRSRLIQPLPLLCSYSED